MDKADLLRVLIILSALLVFSLVLAFFGISASYGQEGEEVEADVAFNESIHYSITEGDMVDVAFFLEFPQEEYEVSWNTESSQVFAGIWGSPQMLNSVLNMYQTADNSGAVIRNLSGEIMFPTMNGEKFFFEKPMQAVRLVRRLCVLFDCHLVVLEIDATGQTQVTFVGNGETWDEVYGIVAWGDRVTYKKRSEDDADRSLFAAQQNTACPQARLPSAWMFGESSVFVLDWSLKTASQKMAEIVSSE